MPRPHWSVPPSLGTFRSRPNLPNISMKESDSGCLAMIVFSPVAAGADALDGRIALERRVSISNARLAVDTDQLTGSSNSIV